MEAVEKSPEARNRLVAWRDRILELFIMALAALSVLISALLGYQVKQQNSCQVRYNSTVVQITTERAVYGEKDRNAIDQLVHDTSVARSRDDGIKALAAYQRTRAATDAERAKHPFPKVPDC